MGFFFKSQCDWFKATELGLYITNWALNLCKSFLFLTEVLKTPLFTLQSTVMIQTPMNMIEISHEGYFSNLQAADYLSFSYLYIYIFFFYSLRYESKIINKILDLKKKLLRL